MSAQPNLTSTELVAALRAGIVAGVLDIGAAVLINGVPPKLILQSIASGLLGMASYAGGVPTVLLGFFLQIAMSVLIAAIFAFSTRRFRWLLSRPIVAGLVYGIVIFVVMNFLVVPLSHFAPHPKHITLIWLVLNIVAMLVFGVIVSLIVGRTLRGADRQNA